MATRKSEKYNLTNCKTTSYVKNSLEHPIKDLDHQIKEAKRADQKQIKALESLRNSKRKSLFEAQNAIDQRREQLIGAIKAKLTQNTNAAAVVSFRWRLV